MSYAEIEHTTELELSLSLDVAHQLVLDLEDLLRECLDTAPEDVRAAALAVLNR